MLKGAEITVVGAGVGGLAAATAMARRGAKVRVLEQADQIREVGAGLQIGPNGVRVLDALGLKDEARARAPRSHAIRLIDGPTGRSVVDFDLDQLAPDWTFLLFHRADLVDMLAHAARTAGVHIETGARVISVSPGEGAVKIEIEGQPAENVPFLVGADGLHSVLRPALNGPAAPFFTGQVAWRALVPANGGEAFEARLFMGPGRHLVVYPLRDGSLINLVAVEERQAWADEGWFHRDNPENLRRAFAGFCAEARAFLERVEEVFLWGLHRHEVAPLWHRGRSALLGDAAHPTLPFMAQGAVMALEDAWVLADSLNRAGLDRGPVVYQARRRPRAAKVIEEANHNARNYHYANPLLRFAGHNALRLAGRIAPNQLFGRYAWIYGHDVTRV
jgi:salicylate hydroxylase